MSKRIFDILFSALLLILLSPFLLIIAALIKLQDGGPVFYRGLRIGKDFKPFRMFKFRTMVVNADKIGGPSTRGDDPRLTRIGLFLRRFNLDELPQLIDIFRGAMSFVGPRPEVEEYAKMYTDEELKIVYAVRPGLTDYATLWNIHEEEILRGAKDTEETERLYLEKIRPEKVRLQIKYVKEMSLWNDIKILFLSLKRTLQ